MSKPEHELAPQWSLGGTKRRLPLSRLVLTGFMGAGKSTVGVLLAKSLAWNFLDLDSILEASHGVTVAEIFSTHGEPYFRDAERRALQQLKDANNFVLALGGGTIEHPDALSYVLNWKETCLVFLDAPLSELMDRISSGAHTRPLLAKPEELASRHERRMPHYRAANVTVFTSGLDQSEVAARILQLVSERWQVGED